MTGDRPDAFASLLATLSGRFINVAADAIDERVEEALALVGAFAEIDRVAVAQRPAGGPFRRTHQWTRAGYGRIGSDVIDGLYPWLDERLFGHGERIVLPRLDGLPPGAARDREHLTAAGIQSLAVFPLRLGAGVAGTLAFVTLAAPRDWPAALVDRLGTIADLFAAVLGRGHAHAELDRHLAFERLLAETSATLVDAPPDAVDDRILAALERFGSVLELDRSLLSQRVLGSDRFQNTHQWVRDDRPEWRVPPTSREQLPWMSQELNAGRAVVLSRMSDLPPSATADREAVAARYGPKSAVILPLTVAGEVIGSVSFASLQRERVWAPAGVQRLWLLARILGSAIARKRGDIGLRASLVENERLRAQLEAENVYLRDEVKTVFNVDEVVGRSPALRAVLHKVDQVAGTGVAVLLLGETGTGKELIARAIHARSGRNGRPLIAVNCAALPPTLIESELFGHEKGAFTGATQARAGRFELADGGTLFLDEIGDLEPALQAKMLRALQEGEIQRLGSARLLKVDVRVIAATNRDLETAMREGRFRSDLYYRLGVFPIEVPPLRERREDIPLLIWHFLQSRQRTLGRQITEIPAPAMDTLTAYDWPGNVRELQSVIDRALILSPGPALSLDEALMVRRPRAAGRVAAPVETLRDAERAHIMDALERSAWIIEGRGQAADRLGVRPSTLRNRMQKLNIRRPPTR